MDFVSNEKERLYFYWVSFLLHGFCFKGKKMVVFFFFSPVFFQYHMDFVPDEKERLRFYWFSFHTRRILLQMEKEIS